jgi:hypothetical protein
MREDVVNGHGHASGGPAEMERTMRPSHPHIIWKTATRCAGTMLTLALMLALSIGVARGHAYHLDHPSRSTSVRTLLSPAAVASTPPNCSSCSNASSSACYNGCLDNGITYYHRNGIWYAYDGAAWYCYYGGCWQVWTG